MRKCEALTANVWNPARVSLTGAFEGRTAASVVGRSVCETNPLLEAFGNAQVWQTPVLSVIPRFQ
jgi:hypothetical protein